MGSSKQPDPITPGEAAVAAMGTAGAGEMMSIANQPVEQYSQLVTNEALGPSQMRTQQSLANQAAYQGAVAQQDIQSRVDPQAYAQRQMRMQAANQRLGKFYNVDPSLYSLRGPSAYAIPGTADMPNLVDLRRNAATIAGNLSTGEVNKFGGDPVLNLPDESDKLLPATFAGKSYLG
jgi:hypothetical protein